MKTFEQIFTGMFNEVYKSPEGWPDNLSIVTIHSNAAKEYAKQWVEQAAYVAMDQAAYGDPVGDAVLKLLKEIDAQ